MSLNNLAKNIFREVIQGKWLPWKYFLTKTILYQKKLNEKLYGHEMEACERYQENGA